MRNIRLNSINVEQYFQHIIQLNPFDAVVILKKDSLQNYMLQLTNGKANTLFQSELKNNLTVEQYFSKELWNKILEILQSPKEDAELTINNGKQTVFPVRITPIFYNDEVYYSIIIRLDVDLNKANNNAIAKHLSFVEQNVNPVLSLDENGTIIYTNIAASSSVTNDNIVGQKIQNYIAEQFVEEFSKVFQRALLGVATIMPKCKFVGNWLNGEPCYLKFFPTYWEGKLIGVHLIMKDVSAFHVDNGVFQYLSLRDELTGLLNRSALKEYWKSEYDHLVSQQQKLALILIDLDRFKKFNESLGEEKGDELMLNFSSRLKLLLNENIRLYRYSGDEFIFIVKNHSREEIELFASKILQVLKKPFLIDRQEYFISVSIGISLSPTDGNDLESLIRKADQALFHVKEHGRSNYKFYRDDMGHAFPNEALMEAHLRRAIEFNELAIHLQPQINLMTNEIDSFEALLRWNNRKFGYVPPSQFIPIAEASGLIIEIGDWILETVCRYQAEWKKRGYRPVRIAVNISPKQFVQDAFARKIETIIRKYDVDPQYIEVEITESSMTNINETYSILTELKQLGVYVSVDDFGTGYSSLSYLKRYPIDIIKIDQSFIADIDKDVKNEAIIKAIILLSHSLGLEVVAEGVEQKFQENFLKEYSCQKVQGYLYNKPLPVEDIVAQYLLN